MTVHILRGGQAICGAMSYPPSAWPEDHQWVGYESAQDSNCPGCVAKFKEVVAKRTQERADSYSTHKWPTQGSNRYCDTRGEPGSRSTGAR